MPTADNKTNSTFQNNLLNKQINEQALTLKLTNFNLEIKSVDERIVNLEKITIDLVQKTQSNLTKLINSVFKSNPSIKDDIISEDDIKKELNSDIKNTQIEVKKKTNHVNTQICAKVKLFKNSISKSLSTTIKFFSNITGSKYFSENTNIIGKIFNGAKGSIKAFFGNTVGGIFNWFIDKGAIIFDVLSKLISPVTSVIKWFINGAMGVIGQLYDKFMWLSKIGWKVISTVWDFFSEKVKTLTSFFSEAFEEVLTSPLGFVLAVGGFVLAINYIIKPAIQFIIKVGKFVWNWVLKQVDNIFFSGDEKKRVAFFDAQIANIKSFFKSLWNDYLIPAYDDTIGTLFNIKSDKIASWFAKDGIIRQYWDKAVNMFKSIINFNIWDDITYVWKGLKDFWYLLDSFFISDQPYEILKQTSMLKSENKERLDTLTLQKIRDLAQSSIYQNLFTFYNNNRNNWKSDEVEDQLKSQATILYENFKQNLKINSNSSGENEKYISMLNLDLNTIVNTIMTQTDVGMKKILDENKYKTVIASETLAALKKYYNAPGLLYFVDEVHSTLNSLVDDSFSLEIVNKMKTMQDQEQKIKEGKLKNLNGDSILIAERLKNLNIGIKDFEHTEDLIKTTFAQSDKILDLMFKDAVSMKGIIEETHGSKFIETISKYSNAIRNEQDPVKKQELIDTALNIRAYRIANHNDIVPKYKDSSIPQKDGGIIAQYPTKVLIAEAGSPELIVPINSEGIQFINDSIVSVLNEELYIKSEKTEENYDKKSILQRIKGFNARPDSKMHDMKNICSGVMGVCR